MPPSTPPRSGRPTPPPFTMAELVAQSRAPATRRAYASDWRDFCAWAASARVASLPASPECIGRYLADRGHRLRPGTLERRVSAIVVAHRQAGFALDRHAPAIAEVLAGLKRVVGTAPLHRKDPLTGESIRAVVATLPATLSGLRDKAVILLGYAGAFRRSELADLRRGDLCWTSEGVAVTLTRSKEDQYAEGRVKPIPYGTTEATCPVKALGAWMKAAKLDEGPLFRRIDRHGNLSVYGMSGEAVAAVVKRTVHNWARTTGVSPDEADRLSFCVAGHSLRSGMITSASEAGASDWQIMAVSLHKTRRSLQSYVRRGRLFADSVAGPGL